MEQHSPTTDTKPTQSASAAVAAETNVAPHATTQPREPSSSTPNNNTPISLSKNQQKKRLRWEKSQAIKKRRKDQEKEVRILKAKHDGRDLDEERKQQLQNEKDGSGWSRREEKWKQILKTANTDNSFRICFDCSFEDVMTSKERGSLGLQLRYVYSVNRKSSHPVHIDVCSLKKGETRSSLEKVAGFPESWVGRCFRTHEGGLEDVYRLGSDKDSSGNDADCSSSSTYEKERSKLDKIGSKPKEGAQLSSIRATMTAPKNKQNLVYLTGDSPNTLTNVCNNTTYIIGGIVDRNRLKRAAINRAEHLSIPTARLPLDEHADFKGSTRILTCNHVFEILLRYRENGGDWRQSILSVTPGRKEVGEKEDGKDVGEKKEKVDNMVCEVVEDDTEHNTESQGQDNGTECHSIEHKAESQGHNNDTNCQVEGGTESEA